MLKAELATFVVSNTQRVHSIWHRDVSPLLTTPINKRHLLSHRCSHLSFFHFISHFSFTCFLFFVLLDTLTDFCLTSELGN